MKRKSLKKLLQGFVEISPDWERKVAGLSLDSRVIKPGDLFFACPGMHTDGRKYINEAIKHGAIAVICETDSEHSEPIIHEVNGNEVPVIPVVSIYQVMGEIAARFYGYPTQKLTVIGITGTNGKTSICNFIANALEMSGQRSGIIGTLGYGLYGDIHRGTHTTPHPVKLQEVLDRMIQHNAKNVVMEVSSHGLEQNRVAGIDFDIAIFTNLSRDHLDYHPDMEAYYAAKRKLFLLPNVRYGIINIDDEYGRRLAHELQGKMSIYAYSAFGRVFENNVPQVRVHHAKLDIYGITATVQTPWGSGVLHSDLIGRFHLSNLLAVLTSLCLLDIPFEDVLSLIPKLQSVPGRMEKFGGGNQPLVIVDYAHTPDALREALTSIREYCEGEIWCVFGCGGDRDQGKRPEMGKIAESLGDHIILTDDNPRSEDPHQIIVEIKQGMVQPEGAVIEHDRYRAIAHAIGCAKPKDMVLVAGKGHENFQIIGKERKPFHDAVAVQMILAGIKT